MSNDAPPISEAPPSPPAAADVPIDADREVRIATVLYGGVSLAIYIHGVTQELLRAVRATAPKDPVTGRGAPLLSGAELDSTEAIYREVGRRAGSPQPFLPELDPGIHGRVRTRFVVDVLAGTSAGGINGIFLAKALANHQKLDGLRALWVTEGDIDLLLNDSRSRTDLPKDIRLDHPPQALLNTRRMYYRLLNALDALEATNRNPPLTSSLVDELDLYVTATDIRGLVLPIALSDRAVFERCYRNVFHFLYTSKAATGDRLNHFDRENNGFLAFAARCTSSFPAAFEPMTLNDLTGVPPWNHDRRKFAVDAERWKGFFKDYLRSPGGRSIEGSGESEAEAVARRAFGDGGYLDNKPFSYATEALRVRRGDRRVQRKLIYVEPSPEHPESEVDPIERPDLFQNLGAAAFSLPRAETIREDLDRVFERNRVVDRVTDAVRYVDSDLMVLPLPVLRPRGPYEQSGLDEMIGLLGPAYGVYHRVKVAQLTWEIAESFLRLSRMEETSGLLVAFRYLVGEWREARYAPNGEPRPPETRARLTENRLLRDYDLGYRVRRFQFLQDRLDGLLAILGRAERRSGDAEPAPLPAAGAADAGPADQGQSRDFKELDAILGAVRVPARLWLQGANRETLRSAVLSFKAKVSVIQVQLRGDGRRLRSATAPDGAPNPIAVALERTSISIAELRWIMETPLEDERRARARDMLAHPALRPAQVDAVMAGLAEELIKMFVAASRSSAELLGLDPDDSSAIVAPPLIPAVDPIPRAAVDEALRHALGTLYQRFESYDAAIFPLQWGTEALDTSHVDVLRVSPEEGTLLNEVRVDGSRAFHKLAGTRFGNFGSFFEEVWRLSDILWGRLDGAERIIRSVLVTRGNDRRDVLEDLILRAQAEVVVDELRQHPDAKARRVMYQCLLRTTSGKPADVELGRLIEKLLPAIEKVDARRGTRVAKALEPGTLRQDYLRNFRLDRELSPEHGLEVSGRASRILGQVLDGLSGKYGPVSKRAGWGFLWAGRILVGLIEVLLPRSWWGLLTRYWLNLLYLIGLLVVLGGVLFNWPEVRGFAIRLLLTVAGLDLLLRFLRHLLVARKRLRALLLLIAFVVAAAGVWAIVRFVQGLGPDLDHRLTLAMARWHWLEPLWRFGEKLCPKC